MANRESYLTIDRESASEFRDRGSRFIAYAFPAPGIDDFKKRLSGLKKEHPKAVHHCFAYRIGNDGEQYRANDDGEPGGTAGLPILGQIDSRQLTFTAIVVVRYFGGTLLGKPGLINAYKSVACLALQALPSIERTIMVSYEIMFEYSRLDEVMQLIKRMSCFVKEKRIGLFSRMVISVPISRTADFEELVREILGAEINKLI